MSSLPVPPTLAHKIAVLVFLTNRAGEHLLLLRAKPPNLGHWSPIGGKLETTRGESPFECAIRETREETGHVISTADLHLFALLSEKAYEGDAHWLLFLFRCTKPVDTLPPPMDEGPFGFHAREAIDRIPLPETDRAALWPIFVRYAQGFVALRIDCTPGQPLSIITEQSMLADGTATV